MAVVINTNVDSLRIQNILNNATASMSHTMQRMSSGLQILSAKDDAAGTVISARMEVQLNGNKIAQKNVQNANALLSTAEGNLDVIEDNIQRIRDLTLQAKNGTYSEEEIRAMQDEVAQRMAEIDRINSSATHSSLRLFGDHNGTDKDDLIGLAKYGATFQVGANDGVDNTIHANEDLFKAVEFSALTGASNFNLLTISQKQAGKTVTTEVEYNDPKSAPAGTVAALGKQEGETEFDQAIRALDLAVDNITHRKSIIGSAGTRMDSALSSLTTQYENLSSAKSIITDTDIAEQASKYTQDSILQQVSTSLLAQANQAPSIALSLV
ncbi:MAG: hypothetical protein IJB79_00935 [Candidatus Gastranaerophilales bacterium]|nr:hypothetical protein [Candidatus Gastranaerophilales bacterium]